MCSLILGIRPVRPLSVSEEQLTGTGYACSYLIYIGHEGCLREPQSLQSLCQRPYLVK